MLISIVIPVLDEAPRIGALLDDLERRPGRKEIIVADGGSRDGTPERAAGRARVVASPPGRARQMNAGGAAAAGEAILFLHCDTRLPPGALRRIADEMADPAVAGGGFIHRFDRDDGFSRLVSFSANLRTRAFRLFFGDQAIFVRREAFERLGGYREMPLFEDWDLSARMRGEGRIAIVETPVTTSARRIEAWGRWRCLYLWWGLSVLYSLGVPARWMARLYPDVR